MFKDKAQAAFWMQRNHAKCRGINWYFEFDEWVRWWVKRLGPDWLSLRGRCKGQYCMARKKDKGPYAVWNVECVLVSENHSVIGKNYMDKYGYPLSRWTHLKGDDRHNSKLTSEQVKEIYQSELGYRELAKKYKCGNTTIRDIRNGRFWRHITEGLDRRGDYGTPRPII